MKKKSLKIKGPTHPISVKMLTSKTLTRRYEKDKTKVLQGLWHEDENTIYLASDLPEDVKLHTFLHELAHALEPLLQRVEEEGRADILGAYFMKLSGCKTLEEFLARMEER